MTTTLTDQTTTAEAIDPAVAEAFTAYQASWQQQYGPVMLAATKVLTDAADKADVPLCQWGDLTPHNVTIRSCCGDAVCDAHEDDHDLLCAEFVAQLREEAL